MDALSTDETRELLIGTWVGVAMVVEMLIEQEPRRLTAAPRRLPDCGFWSNAASAKSLGLLGAIAACLPTRLVCRESLNLKMICKNNSIFHELSTQLQRKKSTNGLKYFSLLLAKTRWKGAAHEATRSQKNRNRPDAPGSR
jgi:hypothetical protein